MIPEIKQFYTYDVDLAAFLMVQGLKFYECKSDPIDKSRALFCFFDERDIGRDLERNWMSSDTKRFSDFRKYLLREVHRVVKQGIK
jgi:hypothetical protein